MNDKQETNPAFARSLSNAGLGWQPIETAPKDGTHILCWREWNDEIAEAWWENRVGGYCFGGFSWSYPKESQPLFWMPKPMSPNVN